MANPLQAIRLGNLSQNIHSGDQAEPIYKSLSTYAKYCSVHLNESLVDRSADIDRWSPLGPLKRANDGWCVTTCAAHSQPTSRVDREHSPIGSFFLIMTHAIFLCRKAVLHFRSSHTRLHAKADFLNLRS
jgi:hypothetical protein